MVTLKCKECNKKYTVLNCRQWDNNNYGKKQRKYCSIDCKRKAMKKLWNTSKEREKRRLRQLGKNNSNWKNGKRKIMGYIYIYYPKPHLHKIKNYNAVPESVLVMEKHLKRRLTKEELVHHKNGIKNDNRIENLKLFKNNKAHSIYHMKKKNKITNQYGTFPRKNSLCG